MQIIQLSSHIQCRNTYRLFLLANKSVICATQAQAAKDLVESQTTQKAVDETAEAKATEELANKAEDTGQQQTDGGNDLAERLHEKTPERVELLLGLGHALELALGVVDALSDTAGEL